MLKLPFYIITSDATKDILPASSYLYTKYWQTEGGQNFTVLGNSSSGLSLSDNFSFVKIKSENNIGLWTKYIYEYILHNETSDYFVMTLDDYLPNDHLKSNMVGRLLTHARNNGKVGRIALGRLDVETKDVIQNCGMYDIVRLKKDSVYRISCQTSIWNREYFLKYFNHDWTPWELELEGSRIAKQDEWEIIGTDRDWAFGWQEESALSGRWPGMVNILGVRPEDVSYLISKKVFKPESLQYGIWYDCKIPFVSRFQSLSKKLTKIPRYTEIGLQFRWSMIKPYVRGKTFKRLLYRYSKIYPANL